MFSMQNKRVKSSSAQLKYLFDFMKANQECSRGRGSDIQEKLLLEQQWQQLTETLNSMGGPVKSMEKWKQAWRDLRNNIKKKSIKYKREGKLNTPGSTDNGPSQQNAMEIKTQRASVAPPPIPINQRYRGIELSAEGSRSTTESDPLDNNGIWPDGVTTCTRGPAVTGCIKQQTRLCGVPWERPMSSSGLQRADDEADDLGKPRIIFCKLVKEKLATAESKREIIKEELEERKLRKQILREELQHKRELHELEKEERLLRVEILKIELRNKRK